MNPLKLIMTCTFLLMFSEPGKSEEMNNSNLLEDSVTDMYIVAGSGLGGAVLGLSTLSFVEEPGDHLKNILIGASLGIMSGVAFVGYNTANKGRDLYYEALNRQFNSKEFKTKSRVAWHKKEMGLNVKDIKELPFLMWGATF